MLIRTNAPGYGHMLKQGYKTLSESWDQPGSSMNHCMFGHAQEWFQESVLGIQQAHDSTGFRKVVLRPEPVGEMTSASGYYDSLYGRIESNWKIEDGDFDWHIAVPPNSIAELHLPTVDASQVTEGGTAIGQSEGIRLLRIQPAAEGSGMPNRVVLAVGSGAYHFRSPWRQQ